MRVKTKIILFIIAFFCVLVLGFFAGWKFAAGGAGIIGLIGAGWSGSALKQAERDARSADRSAATARKTASDDAAGMDRMVQGGDDLARTGKNLVDESERLIRESGLGESPTNKKP